MPFPFANRSATKPQNIHYDSSEVSSNGSTLKMEDMGPAANKAKRSRTCTVVGVFLLLLLAAVSVAAGICYVNHMSVMTSVSQWVGENRIVSDDVSPTSLMSGLGKRQHYSYGQHPTINVTAFTTSAAESATTVTTQVTVTETASSSYQTISSFLIGFNTTATETVTPRNTETITPTPSALSIWTSVNNVTITDTVIASDTVTVTLSMTPSMVLNSTIGTLVESMAGTSTISSFSNNTGTQTVLPITPVSVPVTIVVSTATVMPLPVPLKSTSAVEGVTGSLSAWVSPVSGWNLTQSSISGWATGGSGTVTVTTTSTVDINCTTALGSTVSSNALSTGSIHQSNNPSLTSTYELSTRFITTSIDYSSTSNTAIVSDSTSLSTNTFNSTEIETFTPSTVTTVVTTLVITPSASETVGVERTTVFDTQTKPGTVTVFATQVSITTQTLYLTHSASPTEICPRPAVLTVTATVVETVTQIVSSVRDPFVATSGFEISAQGESSIMETGQFPSGSISASPTFLASDIPLISITPNTTVIFHGQKNGPSASPTCIGNTTTLNTEPMPTSINVNTTSTFDVSTSGLMSHSVSDISVPTSMSISTGSAPSLLTGTNITVTDAMSIVDTNVPLTTVYSTMTMHNQPNTTSSIVPAQISSAGDNNPPPKFWGSAGVASCSVMLVGIISLLLI